MNQRIAQKNDSILCDISELIETCGFNWNDLGVKQDRKEYVHTINQIKQLASQLATSNKRVAKPKRKR